MSKENKETWISSKIYIYKRKVHWHPEEKFLFLVDFVNPLIKSIDKLKIMDTFFFTFQHGFFLLRIKILNKKNKEKIEELILKYLPKNFFIVPEKYDGEKKFYGSDGWKIVQKFYEYSSRFVLGLFDKKFKKGEWFENGKLIHVFLNQHCYTSLDELGFHQNCCIATQSVLKESFEEEERENE